MPVLEGTQTGLLAFRHLFAYEEHRSCEVVGVQAGVQSVPDDARQLVRSRRVLTEAESLSVLSAGGLSAVPCRLARDQEAVVEAAGKIGFPVVLKTSERGVLHKSDFGGVQLGIRDEYELRDAWRGDAPRDSARRCSSSRRSMDPSGIELVLGMSPRRAVRTYWLPSDWAGFGSRRCETRWTFLAPCSADRGEPPVALIARVRPAAWRGAVGFSVDLRGAGRARRAIQSRRRGRWRRGLPRSMSTHCLRLVMSSRCWMR